MRYANLTEFLTQGATALTKGPIAMVFLEDLVEIDTTIRHHQQAGFSEILVFAPEGFEMAPVLEDSVHRIAFDYHADAALINAVNTVIDAAPGLWMYYCFNAEFLFYPFCETRSVGEMLAFHAEERRDAMLTYVIDLYAADLGKTQNAVSFEDALMDRSGYYALARPDGSGRPKERQLNFYGGLRWRFEEHIPQARRKIDRIGLFRAKKGLKLLPNHVFNDEEYNTYACPWHNNITAAICSFRTAKALKSNAGSMFDIHSFRWHNSTAFDWTSQQLLDLGLMEPGQWF